MLLTSLIAASTVALCGSVRRRLNRPQRQEQSFLHGTVRLTSLWNHGAAFGLPVSRSVLTAGAAATTAALLCHRPRKRLGTGLILGGGLSNWAERLRQGKVYDYVQFPKAPGFLKKYVYNLADFAIFAGLLALLFPGRKRK